MIDCVVCLLARSLKNSRFHKLGCYGTLAFAANLLLPLGREMVNDRVSIFTGTG